MPSPPGKLMKKQVSRFCDTTGLDGFAYAKKALSLEERGLWVLSIGIFFGFMVLFLYYQYKDYYRSLTVTHVEIQYPKSVELPRPTLCFQINTSAMESQFDRNNSRHWTHSRKNVKFHLNWIQSSPDFKNDFEYTRFGPDERARPWAYSEPFQRWLVLMSAYISETVKLENFFQSENGNLTFEEIRKFIAPAKANSYTGVTKEIEKHIGALKRHWNLTLVEIVKIVGTALCRTADIFLKQDVFEVRNGRDMNLSYTRPCTVDRITWLGPVPPFDSHKEVLCVSLVNLSVFNFTSRSNSVQVSGAPLLLYKPEDWTSLEKTRSYGIYLKPDGERVFPLNVDTQNLLKIPTHSLSYVPYEIAGVYQAYPTKRRCTNGGSSVLECLQRCRVAAFLRLCGCFPMTHFSMDHPAIHFGKLCTITSLTNASKVRADCLELTRYNSNDSKCESECKPPCKVQIFKFKRVPYRRSKLNLSGNESRGLLEVEGSLRYPYAKSAVYFQQFSYPLYRERRHKEPLDLISDTGNIAGLWLGASLLALIHGIVYTIIALLDCIFANRVSSLPSNNTWLLRHWSRQKHRSQSERLNAAHGDIQTALDELQSQVMLETLALKHVITINS